jgi:hypothetical protein
LINLLFYLKPWADMFYQYAFLDLILALILLVYLFPNLFQIKMTLSNLFLFALLALLIRAYLLQVDTQTSIDFFKIASAILIYFAAQFNKDIVRTIKIIGISYIVPMIYSIVLLLTNNGYQLWGNVLTFVGPYYYKTDLALAVILSLVFFRRSLFRAESKIIKIAGFGFIFLLAPYMIIEANSRLFLIIYGIILIYILLERTKNNKSKINITKPVLFLFGFILLSVAVISYYFYSLNGSGIQISFDPDNFFSESNTQGRSVIWNNILMGFFDGHIFNQVFGYYFGADFDFSQLLQKDSHNTFLKIAILTGYVGLLCICAFLIRKIYFLFFKSRKYNWSEEERINLNTIKLLLLIFLFGAMTQSNIMFTQTTWYVFYFLGLLNNDYFFKEVKEVYCKKEFKRVS